MRRGRWIGMCVLAAALVGCGDDDGQTGGAGAQAGAAGAGGAAGTAGASGAGGAAGTAGASGAGGAAGTAGAAGAGGVAGSAGLGGAAGSAGSGGTAGMTVGACLDDLDLLAPVASTIQDLIAEQCVFGEPNCLLNETVPCIAQCLEDELGLPQDCGECAGLTTQCILENCAGDCAQDINSMQCTTCQSESECGKVFNDCAGFPIPG